MDPIDTNPRPSEAADARPDETHAVAGLKHEPDHVSGRGLLWFLVLFVTVAVVVHIGLWFLLRAYSSHSRDVDRARSVVRAPNEPPKGAAPLQPIPSEDLLPSEDLAHLRDAEDAVFRQLGWEPDPRTGELRIPDAVVRAVASRPAAQTKGGRR